MTLSSSERQQVNKAVKTFGDISKKRFTEVLYSQAVPMIVDTVMSSYDLELTAAVISRDSRTNPVLYRSIFLERLENFEFVIEQENGLLLRTPDMDNFDFSGRLRIIENILDGTAGVYVEVDEEQYVQMYNRQPRRTDVIDPTVPKKQRIYLLRLTEDVNRRLRSNNIRRIKFPFSNSPPIDIFRAADQLVEPNMDRWIQYTINNARRDFVAKYRR
jgi:hypothetical protein